MVNYHTLTGVYGQVWSALLYLCMVQKIVALSFQGAYLIKTVFVLHHIHEYSIAEISEMTDTLPNTVKDRLKHARKQLRKKITTDPVFSDWIQGRMP